MEAAFYGTGCAFQCGGDLLGGEAFLETQFHAHSLVIGQSFHGQGHATSFNAGFSRRIVCSPDFAVGGFPALPTLVAPVGVL